MRIRPARYANSWYSGQPDQLRADLDKALAAAQVFAPVVQSRMQAALLPHAGLRFSAPLIMAGLRSLSGVRDLSVLILAPCHNFPLDANQLYTSAWAGWETPLGQLDAWNVSPGNQAWENQAQAIELEHAIEMFLPVLAYINPQCRVMAALVPAIENPEALRRLSDLVVSELAGTSGPKFLIASSDMNHYGHRFGHTPFGLGYAESIGRVRQRDHLALECLSQPDPEGFLSDWRKLAPTMCGRFSALVLASLAARLGWTGQNLGYYNSAEALAAAEGSWPRPLDRDGADDYVSYAGLAYAEVPHQ